MSLMYLLVLGIGKLYLRIGRWGLRQWRREVVCRPGQTSVLPPPANQISSAIRVLFRISDMGCEPALGELFFPPLSFPPLLSLPFPTFPSPSLEVGIYGERCKLPHRGLSRNWIWYILALKSDSWLEQIYRFSWETNDQISCRIWKHLNSAKHWIAIASKTVTGQYGSSTVLQQVNNQISSVSFLLSLHTALCGVVEHWEIGAVPMWYQNCGNVRGC